MPLHSHTPRGQERPQDTQRRGGGGRRTLFTWFGTRGESKEEKKQDAEWEGVARGWHVCPRLRTRPTSFFFFSGAHSSQFTATRRGYARQKRNDVTGVAPSCPGTDRTRGDETLREGTMTSPLTTTTTVRRQPRVGRRHRGQNFHHTDQPLTDGKKKRNVNYTLQAPEQGEPH